MTWHGPLGDCGCCTCACPGGGTSRRFVGTPTFKATVSGLPSEYVFRYQTTGLGTRNITLVTLTGLDAANGTYFYEATKTTGGCVDTVPTPLSESFTVTSDKENDFFAFGNSSCYPTSSSTSTASINLSLTGSGGASGGGAVITAGETGILFLRGESGARCTDDYDPSLFPGTYEVRLSSVFGDDPAYDKLYSEQKIWINTRNIPSGACYDETTVLDRKSVV